MTLAYTAAGYTILKASKKKRKKERKDQRRWSAVTFTNRYRSLCPGRKSAILGEQMSVSRAHFLKVKQRIFFSPLVSPSSAYLLQWNLLSVPLNAAFCLCLHVKELRAPLCITEIEGETGRGEGGEREREREREREEAIHFSAASLSANPHNHSWCVYALCHLGRAAPQTAR